MSDDHDSRRVLSGLMARIDVDDYVAEVEQAIADMPEYRRFVEGRSDQGDRGRAGIRRNVEMFLRWATDGSRPSAQELEGLRDLIGTRAAESRPPAEGLAVYRRAMGAAWEAVLQSADAEERAVLGGSLDVLLDWLDIVSRAFEEAYAQERDAMVTQAERRARWLLERVTVQAEPGADEQRLADALGLSLAASYRPLVAALADGSPADHLRLAADMRAQGTLAVSEARRVAAVAPGAIDLAALGRTGSLVSCQGEAEEAPRLAETLADLRSTVVLALEAGERGPVDPDSRLPELLLARAPRVARRLEARVFAPLARAGRDDLVRTLELLAEHGFERSAAAAALPVHRNTMVQRIARIRELTGLDPDDAGDRGTIWLATRARALTH